MKKLLILLCFAFFTVVARAHNDVNVNNNTTCDITVTPFCYDANCTTWACSGPVVIPAGTSQIVSYCCWDAGTYRGFELCWDDPQCTTTCVSVTDGTPVCPSIPNSNVLPPCGPCRSQNSGGGATIHYGPIDQLHID